MNPLLLFIVLLCPSCLDEIRGDLSENSGRKYRIGKESSFLEDWLESAIELDRQAWQDYVSYTGPCLSRRISERMKRKEISWLFPYCLLLIDWQSISRFYLLSRIHLLIMAHFQLFTSILSVTLTNHSNSFHSQLNKVHQNRIYCDIAMHTSEKDH